MKKIMLLPALALGLSACGSSTPPLAAPTIDVSGLWVATLQGPLLPVQVFRFRLTQRGNALSGQAEIAAETGPPVNVYDPFGRVSGRVSGDQFSFTGYGWGDYAGSVTLSGTVVAGKLTGTWTNVGASGLSAAGTFTATPSD
ncbi:hypothetical protein DEIPH_ctg008orf0060 [Deinococcus phoenicis]|uniref:Lipoprotein n=1 Tax=Deinococcus phoenicis TaxID=1476583 RepID=A0A016QTE1_9DEIO|nr:hypothetical protein [Deinococcus phoenicis]EYB69343.1 hypothetical protein DEIPH_ctg008orf0060 [Deinococcus phoenicis]